MSGKESAAISATDPGVPISSVPSRGAACRGRSRIVRSIAHEWGVTEDRTGNVVWATLGGPSRRRGQAAAGALATIRQTLAAQSLT